MLVQLFGLFPLAIDTSRGITSIEVAVPQLIIAGASAADLSVTVIRAFRQPLNPPLSFRWRVGFGTILAIQMCLFSILLGFLLNACRYGPECDSTSSR